MQKKIRLTKYIKTMACKYELHFNSTSVLLSIYNFTILFYFIFNNYDLLRFSSDFFLFSSKNFWSNS